MGVDKVQSEKHKWNTHKWNVSIYRHLEIRIMLLELRTSNGACGITNFLIQNLADIQTLNYKAFNAARRTFHRMIFSGDSFLVKIHWRSSFDKDLFAYKTRFFNPAHNLCGFYSPALLTSVTHRYYSLALLTGTTHRHYSSALPG